MLKDMRSYQDYLRSLLLTLAKTKSKNHSFTNICLEYFSEEIKEQIFEDFKLKLAPLSKEDESEFNTLKSRALAGSHFDSRDFFGLVGQDARFFFEAVVEKLSTADIILHRDSEEFNHQLSKLCNYFGLDPVARDTIAYLFIFEIEDKLQELI